LVTRQEQFERWLRAQQREERRKARIRKWRKKCAGERRRETKTKTNPKESEPMNEAAIVPPAKGWRLIARRRFQAGMKLYDRGCEVDPNDLSKNFRAFFAAKPAYVEWIPGGAALKQPRDLPPPEPPPPDLNEKEIEAMIVRTDDPVADWRRLVSAVAQKLDRNERWAASKISDTCRAARDLRLVATRVACAREARRRNVVSVTPNEAGMV
jgi:hypothetical protein